MSDAPLDPAAIIAAARSGFAAPAPTPTPAPDAWENRARVLLWRNGDLLTQAEAIADDPPAAVRAAAAAAAALPAETPPAPETYLEIEVVDRIDPLTPDGLSGLLYSVQLGLHGLILRHDGRVVAGWPSDYRHHALPYAAWVKRLLKEARPPGYRLPPTVGVERFTITHVVGPAIAPSDTAPAADQPDPIAVLSGGVRTVTLDHLTRQGLIDAAARAAAWLQRHQRPDGLFAYEYLPALKGWSKHDSIVRQCGCAWGLATVARLTGARPTSDSAFSRSAARAVERIIGGFVRRGGPGGLAYVHSPTEGRRLGAIPLLLLALHEVRAGAKAPHTLPDELTATLLALQQPSGAFGLQTRGLEFFGAEIYYAGQCALGLARRYTLTRRDRLGEAVRAALAHYRRRWDQGWPDSPSQRLAFLAWMLQACDAWDAASPNPDAVDFAYALADWALPFQFGPDHPNPAWVGGYVGGPGIGTAAYTEGMNAALAIAKRHADPARADRYRRSVLLAHRFLLQLVVEPPDLFRYPGDAHLGGVRRNLVGSTLRCDNAQHFLMAALRTARLLQDEEFRL